MGQEFFIKSETLESKVRQLLPSQGGFGQGFDLSASSQIIPIVDLTESAEGSNLRQDLQTAISFDNLNAFNVVNTTTTIINNTGFYKVFGTYNGLSNTGALKFGEFALTDGVSNKLITQFRLQTNASGAMNVLIPFNFTVFIEAGVSMTAKSNANDQYIIGCTRQVATIDGELVNPS